MKNFISLILLFIQAIIFTVLLSPSKSLAIGADDGKLRTYRLALSTTAEYTNKAGGTKALALASMVSSLTRVNGIFEKDFGLQLILIGNNDSVIYTDPLTDPYSPVTSKSNWRSELKVNLTNTIGLANYDIGHLLGLYDNGGASGGAAGDAGCIGCVGSDFNKGAGYTVGMNNISGDFFDLVVAHEMGHQLGANHTFTHINDNYISQMEPGSGSTLMSYAGVTSKDFQAEPDAYFHAISIQQVTDVIKVKTCGNIISTGNAVPVVNAGLDYTIPKATPFTLTGSATDANTNDVLTYSWEQMDIGTSLTSVPNELSITGPLFRSYPASLSPVRYFPNMNTLMNGSVATTGSEIPTEVLPGVARTLNFRLTVRDNKAGAAANSSDDVALAVDGNAGPFTVDSQNSSVSYLAGTTQTVNWSVAGTDANGVNCAAVDILFSSDGGKTFPIILAAGAPNSGSANIVIPNILGNRNRIMVKATSNIFFSINKINFTIAAATDTTAPTAPGAPVASGTLSSSTNLKWNVSTDYVGVTSYDVYQNGVLKTSLTGTTLSITDLSPSTTYSFTIKAKDAAGNISAASNAVTVTTYAVDTIPPTTPALSVSSSGIGTTYVNLAWTASTDNIGVTGYNIYQNGVFIIATGTSSAAGLSALVPATTYSFTVRAKDAAGNLSGSSNILTVTTVGSATTDTAAPTAATLSASGLTSSSVNLSWSGSSDNVGVTAYDVYQNGILKTSLSGTSLAVSGLSSSSAYSFYIVAKDAAGNKSLSSNIVGVTTLAQVVSNLVVDLSVPATALKRTTVQFSAAASSSAGVTKVEFYVKGALVCTDTAAPYTCSWKAPGKAGTFTVEARAYDNTGKQISSFKSLVVQ